MRMAGARLSLPSAEGHSVRVADPAGPGSSEEPHSVEGTVEGAAEQTRGGGRLFRPAPTFVAKADALTCAFPLPPWA
jgi:hypothetical protein